MNTYKLINEQLVNCYDLIEGATRDIRKAYDGHLNSALITLNGVNKQFEDYAMAKSEIVSLCKKLKMIENALSDLYPHTLILNHTTTNP